jgi:hypothetical protein
MCADQMEDPAEEIREIVTELVDYVVTLAQA